MRADYLLRQVNSIICVKDSSNYRWRINFMNSEVKIGNFEYDPSDEIGSGAFGKVYMCKCIDGKVPDGRKICAKVSCEPS